MSSHLADLFNNRAYLDRRAQRTDGATWSSSSDSGMVATAHYLATAVAADILRAGGNAFDAAAAAAFALAVSEPAESGLGGMAMATLFDARQKRVVVLEGQCRAPALASPEEVRDAKRYRGYRAVAVPTAVSLLHHLIENFGTRRPAEILAPSIELARSGIPMTAFHRELTERHQAALRDGNAGDWFLDENGEAKPVGELLIQPNLANTLQRLADVGLRDFYEGEIARRIDADMQHNGGFLRQSDLRGFVPRVTEPIAVPWRTPAFGDCTLFSPGPPAGGMALVQMLRLDQAMPEPLSELIAEIIADETFERAAEQTASRTRVDGTVEPEWDCPIRIAAIIREARADRRRTRLDVGADHAGNAHELLTADYSRRTADRLRSEFGGSGNTTHLSVMDAAGNAAALTLSIDRCYGAAVATPSLGFLYNGYLKAFKVQATEHPHYLRPNVPARSNAAPSIITRDGSPVAVIGSSGSERIASSIFRVLLALGRGGSPFAAVHAPRIHATPEGDVRMETERFDPRIPAELVRHGFTIKDLHAYSFYAGCVQLVTRDGSGRFHGAADPRRDGSARGPD